MTFGFTLIDPLITHKLKEDSGSENLKSFSILLEKKTGNVVQSIENENGKSIYQGKIDSGKMFTGFPGSMIKNKIEKTCPQAEFIMLIMNYELKVLQIVYLDEAKNIIEHKNFK